MKVFPVENSTEFSPFLPDNDELYHWWRDFKLKDYPTRVDDLVVEINDPRSLTDAEYDALHRRCRKTNMVLYVSKTGNDPDPEIPLAMGRRFGVQGLNHNWLANDNGLTSLTVVNTGVRRNYIPYTNRAIKWHTDGYYNVAGKQIQSLLLHCVQSAARGGENALLDHEIVYIMLREQNPDYIKALMQPDVMTIPARIENGKVARQEEPGPVFSVAGSGDLHMRYTARERNVFWTSDPLATEALAALDAILISDTPYIFRGRLEPGMGLVSNNVLHDRAAFEDDELNKRHYYRARYFDRLNDTYVLS
ncbi:MAG: TauD/TfdA family dioxygenase [Gammaproteobacteria bacterium]|nr:TauD/TfdA family dioxygenase [Gammaproteobacteria bacterium]